MRSYNPDPRLTCGLRHSLLPEYQAQRQCELAIRLKEKSDGCVVFDYTDGFKRHVCPDCRTLLVLSYSGMHCPSCFSCGKSRCNGLRMLRAAARIYRPGMFTPSTPIVWNAAALNYYQQTKVCPLCDRCRKCNAVTDVRPYAWSRYKGSNTRHFDILCTGCAKECWKDPSEFELDDDVFDNLVHSAVPNDEYLQFKPLEFSYTAHDRATLTSQLAKVRMLWTDPTNVVSWG